MKYGKRSISQLLGSMVLATSLTVGAATVPTVSQFYALAEKPLDGRDNQDAQVNTFADSGQLYGEFLTGFPGDGGSMSDLDNKPGNYTYPLNYGLWLYNSVSRSVKVEITGADGKAKYWAQPGDSLQWTVVYTVEDDKETNPAAAAEGSIVDTYFVAFPVFGSSTPQDVSVTYSNASGGTNTVDSRVTQATPASDNAKPFTDAGAINNVDLKELGNFSDFNLVSVAELTGDPSHRILKKGDKVTITFNQKATAAKTDNTSTLAPSDIQYDANGMIYTDMYLGYLDTDVNSMKTAMVPANRPNNWNRVGWDGFKGSEPWVKVARPAVSVKNDLDVPVRYTVDGEEKEVAASTSSSVVGAQYGEYAATAEVSGYSVKSKNSVVLGEFGKTGAEAQSTVSTIQERDKVGPTVQLVLTKDESFPILSTYKSSFDKLVALEGPSLSKDRIAAYIEEMQNAQDASAAEDVYTKAEAEKNTSAAQRIDALTNLTPAQKAQYKEQLATESDQNSEAAYALAANAAKVDAAMGTDPSAVQKAASTDDKDKEAAKAIIEEFSLEDPVLTTFNSAIENASNAGEIAEAIANAKNAAESVFDGLTNLTEAQKTKYKEDFKAASPAKAAEILNSAKKIDAVMGTKLSSTKDNHETDENAAYDEAKLPPTDSDIAGVQAALDDLQKKLDPTQYSDMRNAAANKATQAELADLLKSALNAADDKYGAEFNDLSNLTAEQKKSYKESLSAAKSSTAKQAVVDAAKAINTAIGEEKPIDSNTAKATEADKTAAKKVLEEYQAALDAANVDRNSEPFSYINSDTPTVGQLAAAVKAIKESAVSPYLRAIDELPNLTDELKEEYKTQIRKDIPAKAAETAQSAKLVDTGMDATADQTEAKAADFGEFDQQSVYNAMQNYKDIINGVDPDVNNAGNNDFDKYEQTFGNQKDPSALGNLMANVLKEAQDKTAAKIDALTHLTNVQKEAYKAAIAKAKSAALLNSILAGAKNVDAALGSQDPEQTTATATDQDIEAAKAELIALGYAADDEEYKAVEEKVAGDSETNISAGKLAKLLIDATRNAEANKLKAMKNLTDEQRAEYVTKIKAASPEDIPAILATAGNINAMMGDSPSADAASAAEAEASDEDVAAATAAIKAFKLGADEADALAALTPDKSQAEVAAAVVAAQKKAKDAAKAAIDALENLTSEQKQSYKDAVDAATGGAAIDKILETSGNIDAMMGDSPSADAASAAEAEASDEDVAAATAAIKAFKLGADEADALAALTPDKSQAEVAAAVVAAQKKAKDAAKAAIDALENLTSEQKQSYKDAVDAATGGAA
ncbi:MAG: hypothetical protein Q3972_05600, partial [Corynebacterium sp.]|nr:hypothetical protein [Corynebacterium sp.]